MSSLIINANLSSGFATLRNCAIHFDDNGIITDVFNMSRLSSRYYEKDVKIYDAQNSIVTPGLIDSHLHGIGGFGTEDMKDQSILGMSLALAKCGVTGFLPTVFTDSTEDMIKAIKAINDAMGHEEGARILGINVEGPFISPSRAGAQPVEHCKAVDIGLFDKLIDAGEGKVVCMTVAPELKGMRELALHARNRGIILLSGHTDASYENIIEGMQCGILHTTHFFNAMKGLHHRNPGAVGAVLIQNDMRCEVIADGNHVHPELVKLLIKLKPVENIVLITDSLRPTNQESGDFIVNGEKALLDEDGVFVKASDKSVFFGSALTLNKAVANVCRWGFDTETAVRMASENPARIYNLKNMGMVLPGNYADISIFDEQFNAKAVFIGGKPVVNNL